MNDICATYIDPVPSINEFIQQKEFLHIILSTEKQVLHIDNRMHEKTIIHWQKKIMRSAWCIT